MDLGVEYLQGILIVADDPLSAVANGTGAVLNDLNWVMQNL